MRYIPYITHLLQFSVAFKVKHQIIIFVSDINNKLVATSDRYAGIWAARQLGNNIFGRPKSFAFT
jgi:hypothetical protein